MLRAISRLPPAVARRHAQQTNAAAGHARHLSAAPAAEVLFQVTPFLTHRVDPPVAEATTTADEMHKFFTDMYRMRRMETEASTMYERGLVRGFCHLYNGQEAVAVGIEAAVSYDDCLITAYRNHCQQIARGDTVDSVLAELTGRVTGCSKGKGGSMHLYRKESNYYGGNGIVGAQCPLGAGLAFAQKYNNTGKVAISMFGDGAANQGQLYEAINMSALWSLPSIFVCENNRYGMGTSAERAAAAPTYYTRGDYIPGIKIDGMDVLAVREGMKFAAKVAREQGPIYVEMDTYRYKGHSISDQGLGYRSAEEISEMRAARDPIEMSKRRLIDCGWATEEELKKEEKKIRKEVDAAVKFAEQSALPPETDLFEHIYVGDKVEARGTLISNGSASM